MLTTVRNILNKIRDGFRVTKRRLSKSKFLIFKKSKPKEPGGEKSDEEEEPTPLLPQSPPPTRYATVYGKSGTYHFSKDPYRGKSGLTPRKTELNQPLLSPLTNAKDSWFDKYQQHHLRFTTQQLFDAGVIVDDEAKDNNLEGELFEGFKREKWKRIGTHPMNDGTGRKWTMWDDHTYETCLPALRLASRFISHAQNNDWWDALIAGERRPIAPERIPKSRPGDKNPPNKMNLQSFHKRAPEERLRNPLDWKDWVVDIRIEIQGDDFNKQSTKFWGLTSLYNRQPKKPEIGFIVVRLNPRLLEPLFFLPLNSNERLVQNYWIAVTIIHEYAHALSFSKDRPWVNIDENHPQNHHEPYFEDEWVTELGYSAENSLFSGIVPEFPRYDPREYPPNPKWPWGGHKMFMAVSSYGHWRELRDNPVKYGDAPHLVHENDPWGGTIPIPLKFIEDMQQEEFWTTHIIKFGGNGLRPYPKIMGLLEEGDAKDPKAYRSEIQVRDWPEYEVWKDERTDPEEFARSWNYRGYAAIQVAQGLRTRDRIEARLVELEQRKKSQETSLTAEKKKEVDAFMKKYQKEMEKFDRKRIKDFDKTEEGIVAARERRAERIKRGVRRAASSPNQQEPGTSESGDVARENRERWNDHLKEACHKRPRTTDNFSESPVE